MGVPTLKLITPYHCCRYQKKSMPKQMNSIQPQRTNKLVDLNYCACFRLKIDTGNPGKGINIQTLHRTIHNLTNVLKAFQLSSPCPISPSFTSE